MPTTNSPRQVELQPRDLAILRGLFECRLMTLKHAAALHFDGNGENAKKRVQKLKASRLIGERKDRQPRQPSILVLRKAGFDALRAHKALDGYPSIGWKSLEARLDVKELTIRHELDVMTVKAALQPAIAKLPGYKVGEFSTWPVLYQFTANRPPFDRDAKSRQRIIKPDAFIRIHDNEPDAEENPHRFFLELDRGTESLDTVAGKAWCYRDYYQRGGLAAQHGRPRSEFEQFPFRVLMVFKSPQRRNNVAARLLQLKPVILTQVMLTTFKEITSAPLGPVWITPRAYRESISVPKHIPGRKCDFLNLDHQLLHEDHHAAS